VDRVLDVDLLIHQKNKMPFKSEEGPHKTSQKKQRSGRHPYTSESTDSSTREKGHKWKKNVTTERTKPEKNLWMQRDQFCAEERATKRAASRETPEDCTRSSAAD